MRRGILASRDELCSLRQRIARKPFDAFYDVLRKRCALILEAAPVTETHWRQLWQQGRWNAAVTAARTAQGRILDLVIAHHIDRNDAYRNRAIEELKDLVAWSAWVDPCHNDLPADLCTAEAAVAAVIALDWLWEDLSSADRARVLQAIRKKAIAPYCQAVEQQVAWYNCYHSWNAVVNSGCGLAALALADEESQAQQAYRSARAGLRHFFDALGREGGWDEGTGYWGYAMRYLLLFGEACGRLLDDQGLFHQRGMDTTGLFGVYFAPNGRPASFGDSPGVPLYGTLYLLVKHFGTKEVTWWLDTYAFHRDVSTTGFSAAGLAILFRPVDAETTRALDLGAVKVFKEIGWAAMADRWPRPGMYVAAKTGDLSANHSQYDMNSLQLQVDGEMLLTDLGHAPYSRAYFSDERSEFYEVQARAHNTIVVADREHRIDAQGSIVEAQEARNFRWVACDAGRACGENVRFIRHAVMVVDPGKQAGHTLIVLDELDNGVPERVSLYWHTAGRIELDKKTLRGRITGRQAGVDFALASTVEAQAKTGIHRLASNRCDHVVHVGAGVVGKALFASVFSRKELPGSIEMRETASGLHLAAGPIRLDFKALKHRLQLTNVVSP